MINNTGIRQGKGCFRLRKGSHWSVIIATNLLFTIRYWNVRHCSVNSHSAEHDRKLAVSEWLSPCDARTIGGDLGGTGGTVPQKLRWGRPMHLSPPIFWGVVLSDACESRKYELSDKRCRWGFFKKKRFFSWRKSHMRHHIEHLAQ